jgi:hypothetical protein
MLNPSRIQGRGLRDRAGSALRWITAFDPFGSYAPSTRSR